MATIKEMVITRDSGVRPSDNVVRPEMVWGVEEGQPYDLIKFSINELDKPYYWNEEIAVPCGKSEEEIRKIVEEYAKVYIDEQMIRAYYNFLDSGEKWGWD